MGHLVKGKLLGFEGSEIGEYASHVWFTY